MVGKVTGRNGRAWCEKRRPSRKLERVPRSLSRMPPMDRLSRTRRELPVPRDARAAAARLRRDRARPGARCPGGYSFAAFSDELERRVGDVPMFHRKLAQVPLGLDHPVWVDDDALRHRPARAPDGPARARRRRASSPTCAATSPGIPLDRSRPLWEMWVIEGLDDGQGRGLHQDAPRHRRRRLRRQPDLAPVQPRARRAAARRRRRSAATAATPGEPSCSRRGVVDQPDQAGDAVAKLVAPTAGVVTNTIGRARSGTAMAAPFTAPRTSFNGTITGHRTIALADMSLDDDQGDQERRPARPSTTWC